VLACCDKELVGKELKKGKLKIKVSDSFYRGEPVGEKRLLELIEEFESINLIGKKVVSIAVKKGIASQRDIIRIGKVPHLQIFKV
jgi:hypothetical protein